MITDARVFQEDFVPSDVVHRHDEIDALTSALSPVLRDETPENAFLFGPTGAGKTCVARYAVGELQRELIDVDAQYVNCWQDYTRFRVLYEILDAIGETLNIHRRSTPMDELVERLREATERPYVVILDEVDQLEDKGVLYDLYRIPAIAMVLVANSEAELFVDLEDRVHSRLKTGVRVQFDRYGTDELTAILRKRAEAGLEPGAVTERQLRGVADAAAGDARVAIGSLRAAARTARERGLDRVTDAVVEQAVPDARHDIRQKTVDRLTDHQRTLYDIVREAGEIPPGDLYEAYEARVDEPRSRRMVRNYLSKMAHYNLVVAEGENRGRTYRPAEPDG